MERVLRKFAKAQMKAQITTRGFATRGMQPNLREGQFSLPTDRDAKISVVGLGSADRYFDGKKIDRAKLIGDSLLSLAEREGAFVAGRRIFVKNRPSGRLIQVTAKGLRHGLTGTQARVKRNAQLTLVIGDVLETAVPVVELKPREGAKRAYAMLGAVTSDDTVYPVRINIIETDEDMAAITGVESYEGISKQYLYSANALNDGIKKGTGGVMPRGLGENPITLTGSNITLTDFWSSVKGDFLADLGEGVQFSLPAAPTTTAGQETASRRTSATGKKGGRQPINKTLQESRAMPQQTKDALISDPNALYYDKDSIDAQLMRAWDRIRQEGEEAVT